MLPDSTPHAAAVHYSHIGSPLVFYFSTDNTSRKCQGLLNGETVKAAVVIGFSEEEWATMQMEGKVNLVTDNQELLKAQQTHYDKHPNSAKYKDEPETVFLVFTPTWWRYTDYNTDPETLISSE